MNAIINALGAGYSANKVLQYLSKSIPSLAPAIQKAQIAGYGADKILSFLGESVDKEETKHLSGPRRQARNNFLKGQLVKNAAATMAGGLASGVPAIASNLQQPPNLPNAPANPVIPVAPAAPGIAANAAVPPQGAANAAQTAVGPAPAGQQAHVQNLLNRAMPQGQKISIHPTSQPPVNQVATSMTQPVNPVQPEVISNPKEYLEKAGVLKDVDRMLKEKNTPEAISAVLGLKSNVPGKVKGQVDPELLANIEAYSKMPKEDVNSEKPEVSINEPEKRAEKGSVVSSPYGEGKVLELRNGKALIEVDGKKHKVNEDELDPPEFSDDEVADAYDNIMAKIPEEHRSGFISWAGYDEDRNVLGFIPRGGKSMKSFTILALQKLI